MTQTTLLRHSTWAATAALIGVTAIWGSTFVMMKDAIERQPVMDFLFTRFTIAAIFMIAIRPRAVMGLTRAQVGQGVILGLALGFGYIVQTFGLERTSAAVNGFITGMFVVFTPIIGALIFRKRIGSMTWLAVLVATAGLALISLRGWAIGSGEMLTLMCALLFAVHIVGLGAWSRVESAYGLATVQVATVALLCGLISVPTGFASPPDRGVWAAALFTAIFATAIAFIVQTWSQSLMPPTRAAIIMTMEPVFAGIFAIWIGGELLSARTLAGGALVVAAMYLVELAPRRPQEAPGVDPRLPRLEP
jgi:drug/metabolite transporter (DMT)-like permease